MTSERFQTEYLPLSGTFYQVAHYILEDAAEAEDAVQELFLKLWADRDGLDAVHNPKGYGIRVLRNLCLDRVRRRSKVSVPSELPEQEWPGRQDEAVDNREKLAKVLAAIKSLPDRQRTVLTLRTLDGLSYEEITERTGIGNLTLRVLLSQARRKIKTAIL